MNAVLSNPNHPEYGVATIPFPIPTADYDNCIALLTALEIGGALRDDCKVEEIAGEYPFFQKLEGTVVNVEELDYLVKHMKRRDPQELAKFDFIPDIRTPMQYGKHMICESRHFEYDDNLGDYYNFAKAIVPF